MGYYLTILPVHRKPRKITLKKQCEKPADKKNRFYLVSGFAVLLETGPMTFYFNLKELTLEM